MPLTSSSPQPIDTSSQLIGMATYYEILGFGFDQPVNGSPSLSIRWGCAASPPSAGVNVAWLKEGVTLVTGTTLQAAMNAVVTSGSTRYQEIKSALYSVLQSLGVFPAGTVS